MYNTADEYPQGYNERGGDAVYTILIVEGGGISVQAEAYEDVSYISESEVPSVNRDNCDVLIMSGAAAHRLLSQKVPVVHKGVETIIAASEKNWDLTNVIEGAHFIDASCGKEEMTRLVDEILSEAKTKRAKANFEKMVLEEAERVKPILREQLLRDFILGIGDTDEIFGMYCRAFGAESDDKVRMVIMKTDPEPGFDEHFFVKNLAEGYIGKKNLILSTAMKESSIFVVKNLSEQQLADSLKRLSDSVKRYYGYASTIVYSAEYELYELSGVYERLEKCISYCFYSKGELIISAEDINPPEERQKPEPDYCAIEKSIKNGDVRRAGELLDGFFNELEKVKLDPAIAKTYCLELYVCVIRCCDTDKIDKYMKGIMKFQSFATLEEIKEYAVGIAEEITLLNLPRAKKVYSPLISDTLSIIDENIGNENLSLRWLAGSILYTNVDYLGKVFKKEVGENFSHYVMTKRMEMAKKLIIGGEKDKIYEVAEKVGYGANSQYFSQVFKKYTGVSPLEYKEFSKQRKQA